MDELYFLFQQVEVVDDACIDWKMVLKVSKVSNECQSYDGDSKLVTFFGASPKSMSRAHRQWKGHTSTLVIRIGFYFTLWNLQSFLKVNIVVILFSHVSEQKLRIIKTRFNLDGGKIALSRKEIRHQILGCSIISNENRLRIDLYGCPRKTEVLTSTKIR